MVHGPQILVPVATVENLGSWTTVGDTNPHDCVDETIASADDASTYVDSGTPVLGIGNRLTLRLSNPSEDPDPYGQVRLRARHRRNGGLVSPVCRIDLYDSTGVTNYHQMMIHGLNSWQTANSGLSAAQVASITDYNNLLLVIFRQGSGTPPETFISTLDVEVAHAVGNRVSMFFGPWA